MRAMELPNRQDLLCLICQLSFQLVDLNLYLDNYPECYEALVDYNRYSQDLAQYRYLYETNYGPLLNFGFTPSQYPFKWVDEPWPWE